MEESYFRFRIRNILNLHYRNRLDTRIQNPQTVEAALWLEFESLERIKEIGDAAFVDRVHKVVPLLKEIADERGETLISDFVQIAIDMGMPEGSPSFVDPEQKQAVGMALKS